MRTLTLGTLGLFAALVSGVGAQQPTFRSGVELVEIDVVVTDKSGMPVRELAADDFELFEGRTRQPISSFSLVDIPQAPDPGRFTSGTPPSDVIANEGGRRRLYVFAIGFMPDVVQLKARQLLRQFVERNMSPGDIGALVYIGRAISSNAQAFTTNHQLLLQAIDRIMLASEGESVGRPMTDFRALAESIANIPAPRKTMLLVTSGFPDVLDVIDYQGGVAANLDFDDFREAIRAATRGNVAIYTVDANGLSMDDQTAEVSSSPNPNRTNVVPLGGLRTGLSAELMGSSIRARANLRTLAEMTGGTAVVGTNNFATAFAQIARENSTYYVLGYASTNDRQDGRFRRVRVRVKRPGLEVRARSGYVEPTKHTRPLKSPTVPMDTASRALRAAIGNAISSPGLPIQVVAAPFKEAGTEATAIVPVAITVGVAPLGLVERNGQYTGELEIGHLGVDNRNRVTPFTFHRVALSLSAADYQRALTSGVRVLTGTRLAPGRHQLRIGAGNGADVSGSVIYDIDVPHFTRGPLTMSGVALTMAGNGDDALTVRHQEPLRALGAGSLLTARTFTRDDTVTVVAAVYDNDRRSSHSLNTSIELRTTDGRRIQGVAQQISSADMPGGEHVLTAPVRLSGLEPGRYVIHVEARSTANPDTVVSRSVPIQVE